jgi:hypothetical protein
MLTAMAKAGEEPSVGSVILAAVIAIGIVGGLLFGIASAIGSMWHAVFDSGASAHMPTQCRLPRPRQSGETYECPQGHMWVSYRHQRRVPGRLVYDPSSWGPPQQKRLIREPDGFVDDGLKWRYKEQRESVAVEAPPH